MKSIQNYKKVSRCFYATTEVCLANKKLEKQGEQ
jgi:hypothetical protein